MIKISESEKQTLPPTSSDRKKLILMVVVFVISSFLLGVWNLLDNHDLDAAAFALTACCVLSIAVWLRISVTDFKKKIFSGIVSVYYLIITYIFLGGDLIYRILNFDFHLFRDEEQVIILVLAIILAPLFFIIIYKKGMQERVEKRNYE